MSKVLCSAPFNSLTINPDKSVVPCCAWDNNKVPPLGNLSNQKLIEILNSKTLKNLQEDMLANKWHTGCLLCKQREQDANTSTRISLYNNQVEYDPSNKIKWLEFNSSNTCNLACITCGPFFSSYWTEYINKNPILKPNYSIIPSNIKVDDNYFKQIDFSKLQNLILKGGEPFLNKGVLELLKHLDNEHYLQNIHITIVTNGTIYDEKLFGYLKKAKSLRISVSIDACGELNEWIRYSHNAAASIQKIYDNIVKLLELSNINTLHLSAVVSAFNIFYLRELQVWWNENILPISKVVENANFPHIIVSSQLPSVLNLTQKSIDYLYDYYSQFNDSCFTTVIKLLTNKYLGNENHNKFVNFTLMHNNNRNIDIFKVAPKLVNELVYINE